MAQTLHAAPNTDGIDAVKRPVVSNRAIADDERAAVAKAAYEHLRATRDHDAATYPLYLQKTRYLMTVVIIVFASMSYALAKIGWVFEAHGSHLVILCVVGGLAAFSLVIAFGYGIRCHHIRASSVVNVKALKSALIDGSLTQLKSEEFYHDVSVNLAKALLENRAAEKTRAHWGVTLNWTTLVGFVLGAAFVGYAITGNVVTGDDRKPEEEISIVQPENDRPTSVEPTAPSGDNDRPSIVEPSDSIQTDERPPANVRPGSPEHSRNS